MFRYVVRMFKPMKREAVLKALEGQTNVLSPAIKAHEEHFRNLTCVACGSQVIPIVNPKQLFREGALLPNFLAKCKTCGVEFEPYSKIQVNLSSPP